MIPDIVPTGFIIVIYNRLYTKMHINGSNYNN